MKTKEIFPRWLSLKELEEFLHPGTTVTLSEETLQKIRRGREFLETKIKEENGAYYGINTGFGALCNTIIPAKDLEQLQYNLIHSHACGTGEALPSDIVKIMLLLKAIGLAHGKSGVRPLIVKALLDLYNHQIYPVVYEKGSLGASGDLVPLAHLSLPLIGKGEVEHEGKIYPASEILTKYGLSPLTLSAKEGLALLNGTQFMSAIGCYVLLQLKKLLGWSDLIAAASLEAFDGSNTPFDLSVHKLRPFNGPYITAQNINTILHSSPHYHTPKEYVQDPYSFRCIPQVHGAVKDVFFHVRRIVETEINSVTDNPIILPDENKILSGGNFHGEPLAMAYDYLTIAMSEQASISERRIYKLLSGQRGLPLFLALAPGLHSGFMILQYTAASLVSQNKQLSTPCSVDTIDSSNGQEDHVSMGANAAVKMLKVLNNLHTVLAMEWMVACQALDIKKMHSSEILMQLHHRFRQEVPFIEKDILMAPYIQTSIHFLHTNFPCSINENLLLCI